VAVKKELSFLVMIMSLVGSNILFGAGDKKVRFLGESDQKCYGAIAQDEQQCPMLVVSELSQSLGTQTDCQNHGLIIKYAAVCSVDDVFIQSSKAFRSVQTQVAWKDIVLDRVKSHQVEKPLIKKGSETSEDCMSMILNCLTYSQDSK
jgi:hypothetical protein